jgi:hypothetical protein
MKTTHCVFHALLVSLVSIIGLSSVRGQTSLDFVPFEYAGVANVSDLDYIDLEALIIEQTSGVSIGIFNRSLVGSPGVTASSPTVTRIYFEDRTGALGDSVEILTSTGSVSFVRDDGANLPGGNRISFEVDTAFTATAPPSKNGLDPGESVTFLFGAGSYNSLVAAIFSGNFRIGLHVQEIGLRGEDSAAFVSIPEPGSALLGLVGMLLLMRRRR